VLVAAARSLRDSGMNFQIALVSDGPLRPEIDEAIRRIGLADHVSITGWVSGTRVQTEIAGARALLLPSFLKKCPSLLWKHCTRSPGYLDLCCWDLRICPGWKNKLARARK
jgi:colanic acid/amylovoran biosynthesis glycosyltransferase